MRGSRRRIQVAASSLMLLGCLAAPGAALADSAPLDWDARGCAPTVDVGGPIDSLTLSNATLILGLDGEVDFRIHGAVVYPAVVDPTMALYPQPLETASGTLTLTLEVLPDWWEDEDRDRMKDLGFDTSAMEEPAREPLEVELPVTGRRQVDKDSINPETGEADGWVSLLEVQPLRANQWESAYGAYSVVDAQLDLASSDGDTWCEVELIGSTNQPLAVFVVAPSKPEIDAAEQHKASEAAEQQKIWVLAAVGGFLLVALVVTVARSMRGRFVS